jgi:hypothetical protein
VVPVVAGAAVEDAAVAEVAAGATRLAVAAAREDLEEERLLRGATALR